MANRAFTPVLSLRAALAAPRTLSSSRLLVRASTRCLHTCKPLSASRPQHTRTVVHTQRRRHSAAPTGEDFKVYSFDEVKKLADKPEDTTVIIDVREPHEFQAGYIPGAINIPVSSQPDALFLSEEDFLDRFGFEKPNAEKEAVFYCKAGVRSSAAAQIARQAGYGKVVEYRGSWNDWMGKGGKVERP